MATMAVTMVASALAAVTLRAYADADLVYLGRLGAGWDEPTSAALVAGENLVAVKLEQAESAKDVRWLWFGSGLVRWVR